MFKDKTVALIGPAPHIEGFDQSDKIDGYDLVCRLTTPKVEGKVKENTTGRCDILFCLSSSHGIKYVQDVKQLRVSPLSFMEEAHSLMPLKPYLDKTVSIHPDAIYPFIQKYKSKPHTGTSAIMDILLEKPKELYITGFTFFQGKAYHKGYRDEDGGKHDNWYDKYTGPVKAKGKVHRPHNDLACFVNNIYPLEEVTTDGELKSIVERYYNGL